MAAADVRYRCCEHCVPGPFCPDAHLFRCEHSGCPGRMPIDPDTEG